jgi:hypothetical protein
MLPMAGRCFTGDATQVSPDQVHQYAVGFGVVHLIVIRQIPEN